ncbi:hypothetical protein JAAARDRAFT_29586 [Jaapia argillacea MUCL 33604]|uniref:Uncharacterized protein n=1 Tax=Jaapia argillacea MUCL 33604 TaxID=933084 RepID=A0A067QBM8_9AGAM|nr:hypothetical protein JAAARDRAFT_29586 [Jaapia argillacea MUCL 33604]
MISLFGSLLPSPRLVCSGLSCLGTSLSLLYSLMVAYLLAVGVGMRSYPASPSASICSPTRSRLPGRFEPLRPENTDRGEYSRDGRRAISLYARSALAAVESYMQVPKGKTGSLPAKIGGFAFPRDFTIFRRFLHP